MPFIGPKPADTVLDSTLIADGSITSAKIADGAIVNADLNNSAAIATSKITGLAASATTDTTNAANIASGTIADARISASSVQQHATSFDDNKLVNDISTLALRQASNENKGAYNTNSMYVDVFQDSTGITGLTNCLRNDAEYISSTSQPNTATSVNMGANNVGRVANGVSVPIGSDGNLDISGWSINSEGSPDVDDTYGVKIDLGSAKTLATPLRWLPNGKRYKSQGSGSNDYNAGITEINFGSSDGSGWQFGSGGVTPTVTKSGDFTEWSNLNNLYNQDFDNISEGYYHSSGTASTGSDYIQYAWSGTVTGRYIYISMNPTNGVFNGFTITDANGNLFAPVTSATGSFTSNNITAPSSTSKMGAIITYQDNAGTNTLNTDIVLKLSADGGSNYATATMTAMPDFASGIKMAKVNDLSVTAGTSLKYKIEFANQASGSKEARIRGVSLQY